MVSHRSRSRGFLMTPRSFSSSLVCVLSCVHYSFALAIALCSTVNDVLKKPSVNRSPERLLRRVFVRARVALMRFRCENIPLSGGLPHLLGINSSRRAKTRAHVCTDRGSATYHACALLSRDVRQDDGLIAREHGGVRRAECAVQLRVVVRVVDEDEIDLDGRLRVLHADEAKELLHVARAIERAAEDVDGVLKVDAHAPAGGERNGP